MPGVERVRHVPARALLALTFFPTTLHHIHFYSLLDYYSSSKITTPASSKSQPSNASLDLSAFDTRTMLVREMLVIYAAALCSLISPDFWTLVFTNFPRSNVRLVDWSIGLCTMAGSAVLNYSALVSIWEVSNASSCASLRVLFVCTVVASAWVWYTVGWEVIRMFYDLDASIAWI